nr:hypothetical protein Iba_chr07dCG10390 [Ipomoea batatas]
MIPVGPLFNQPQTYKPFSTSVRSPEESLRTRPLMFGTMPAFQVIKLSCTHCNLFPRANIFSNNCALKFHTSHMTTSSI